MTRSTGTLHEDSRAFVIISRSFLLSMKNISESCIERTHTFYVHYVFSPENPDVYEIMWILIVSLGECNNPAQKRCDLHSDNKIKNRHALIIFSNTCCLSAATVVTRTRLSVPLYVHCPSWFSFAGGI